MDMENIPMIFQCYECHRIYSIMTDTEFICLDYSHSKRKRCGEAHVIRHGKEKVLYDSSGNFVRRL